MKKITFSLALCFILLVVKANITGNISINQGTISFTVKNGYDVLGIPGYDYLTQPGAPMLPVKNFSVSQAMKCCRNLHLCPIPKNRKAKILPFFYTDILKYVVIYGLKPASLPAVGRRKGAAYSLRIKMFGSIERRKCLII